MLLFFRNGVEIEGLHIRVDMAGKQDKVIIKTAVGSSYSRKLQEI